MRRKKPSPKPLNPDNVWCDEVRHKCALAIVRWLKTGLNIDRQIKTINIREMEGIAEAATAEWIKCASERIAEAPTSPEAEYASTLLM